MIRHIAATLGLYVKHSHKQAASALQLPGGQKMAKGRGLLRLSSLPSIEIGH